MKLSEAILKGMERFPEQLRNGDYARGDCACALGCAYWAFAAQAGYSIEFNGKNVLSACYAEEQFADEEMEFLHEYGIEISEANDKGISREDIAGMLMAIGE